MLSVIDAQFHHATFVNAIKLSHLKFSLLNYATITDFCKHSNGQYVTKAISDYVHILATGVKHARLRKRGTL